MNSRISKNKRHLKRSVEINPAAPLWQRAPTRDENGNYLSDFMMLIPGLKRKSIGEQEKTAIAITQVLQCYGDTVVFADLNLKLNVLWVSLYPVPGMCLEIPAAIKVAVPEAMLVASKHHE